MKPFQVSLGGFSSSKALLKSGSMYRLFGRKLPILTSTGEKDKLRLLLYMCYMSTATVDLSAGDIRRMEGHAMCLGADKSKLHSPKEVHLF